MIPAEARVYLVCTVEDADFLARGLLDVLVPHLSGGELRLACFWNQRQKVGAPRGISLAPIVRRYEEPLPERVDVLVVLKSIISGACTVRTNIAELVGRISPERILVVAPVVFSGSEDTLREQFAADVSARFEFVYLAEDDERDVESGIVTPGIGGNVYSLLGFGDQDEKNRYCPELLLERGGVT